MGARPLSDEVLSLSDEMHRFIQETIVITREKDEALYEPPTEEGSRFGRVAGPLATLLFVAAVVLFLATAQPVINETSPFSGAVPAPHQKAPDAVSQQ
ncbi:MAG TPA: hypothetical protein V6D17_21555 [Candidatus Obscuribacterales bacterium]